MTGAARHASTWALVPLKSSAHAKSRLAHVLDPEQRAHLFFALAERVIRALQASESIDAVAVITSSSEVAAFATKLGAVPILQSEDVGMSPALQLGLYRLQAMQPRRVLMLPGDLPLITSTAVDSIVSAAEAGASVVLVPDRHRDGTNALLCSPPHVLAPRFGDHSFQRHLAEARASGLATRVMEVEELALDLDCLDDLDHLRLHGGERGADLFITTRSADALSNQRLAALAE